MPRWTSQPRRPISGPPGASGRRQGIAALIAALVLVTASCGVEPTETAEPGTGPPSPTTDAPPEPTVPQDEESPEPEPVEDPVPRELRFTAPKLGGGTIRGAEYGGRDVAVWFWAPW